MNECIAAAGVAEATSVLTSPPSAAIPLCRRWIQVLGKSQRKPFKIQQRFPLMIAQESLRSRHCWATKQERQKIALWRRKVRTPFRTYQVVVLRCLTVYTLIAGSNHGWNLLPVFFSDIAEMKWAGRFNFDFMTFLSLPGIWVAWCHQFALGGIILGVMAFFGGMMFLAPYLLYASVQADGDAKLLFLGKERATR